MGDSPEFARVIFTGKLKYAPGAKILPGKKKTRCEALVTVGEEDFTLVAYDDMARSLDGKDRGTQVHVVGRLHNQTWETRQDGDRSKTVVLADALRFTGKFVCEDVP